MVSCVTLLWLPAVVSAVRVTVNTPSVQVTRGGSALLPCSFRTSAALTRLNIIWTVSPLQEPRHPLQVIAYEQGRVQESLSEYLGRVSFASPPTRDASIFLNHTRVTDAGTYLCAVLNPPDGATPNIGLVGLTVLVPPSTPLCTSDGPAQEGGRIRLRCAVTEGIPPPQFQWEKMSPDGQQLIASQEAYGGSATLTNITSQTPGQYRCTATNLLGSRSCAIQIHLHDGEMSPLGIFAAVTITLIMGLVLLALCTLVLYLHQQSRGKWLKVEKLSNPSRMEEVIAGPPPVSRAPCGHSARPVWMAPLSPVHILYSTRQLSLTPVLETLRPPPSSESSCSMTESDEEDLQPAQHSSLYSLNSGFLV